MNKIEHIGIAVKNMDLSEQLFTKILNVKSYKREVVASESVLTSFFQAGPNKIELLHPTSEESPIQKFLDKKGEGIHHIAFAVDNIKEEMNRLREEGFILLNEFPKKGADGKWVCFLHPKGTNSVLIELCQDIRDTEDGF
ncbi:MAG: methylmalonyl-CoA epimerase [Saprospiraceae bacterium]|nr:methylmalonyl-CoA epimerase [Saprospiraceae bacterium]MBK8852917.1 methylmalonyl-CoA epimerase [Saprospiraceae bacterium]